MATAATVNTVLSGEMEASATYLEDSRLEVEELAAVKAELEQVRAQLYGVLEGARTAFSAENGVVRALAEAEQIDEVADSLLDVLCEAFDFDVATFWLLDPEDEKLLAIAHHQAPTRRARFLEKAIRSLQLSVNEGIAGRVFVEREEFLSDDALSVSHPELASLLGADGLHTVCAFPVSGSGAPLGVIEMERREPLRPDQAIESAVRVIGDRIGIFIEHSQLRWRYFSLVGDLRRKSVDHSEQNSSVIPFERAA
ncbi:MAG: GAF domain-containing protein [Gaiellaceae bacterium]|jgi:GAF domain-containing protein